MKHSKIYDVPTNIITGFLGSGKTSVILNLLQQRPAHERWAILVNEFGEIGVDGSLMQGQLLDHEGVFIKEVPGGCMCCTAGVSMQIALNQLLKEANPHRLLIEPTGLGHPIEILQVLSNKYNKNVLNIEKSITLVDARNLKDARYTEHDIFNQQIAIADIVVGSKSDLYTPSDKKALSDFINQKTLTPQYVGFIEHGNISLDLLLGPSKKLTTLTACDNHHSHANTSSIDDDLMLKSGFVKAINSGEGFQSIGWRFSAKTIFDRPTLYQFLKSLNVVRVKAVFNTADGMFGYNTAGDGIIETSLNKCKESRIEIINNNIDEQWEHELLKLIKS